MTDAVTWEYKIHDVAEGRDVAPADLHETAYQRALDQLGAEGWELVTVTGARLYLKRPKAS